MSCVCSCVCLSVCICVFVCACIVSVFILYLFWCLCVYICVLELCVLFLCLSVLYLSVHLPANLVLCFCLGVHFALPNIASLVFFPTLLFPPNLVFRPLILALALYLYTLSPPYFLFLDYSCPTFLPFVYHFVYLYTKVACDNRKQNIVLFLSLQDRANQLFKQVHEQKNLKGRSNDAIASARLYIACRQEGVPGTFKGARVFLTFYCHKCHETLACPSIS